MPDEDQGYIYVSMQLPIAASMERTSAAAKTGRGCSRKHAGVQYTTNGSRLQPSQLRPHYYNSFFFVTLKPWGERKGRAEQYQEIKNRLNQELSRLRSNRFWFFRRLPVPGVGTSGGFQFVLEDRSGQDVQFLSDNLNKFLAAARKAP